MPLLTVGHGTLGQRELADLLTGAGTTLVVDVRRYPGSRRHPHVNRGELERWLPEHGIGYRWEERLGGRRERTADSPHVAIRNASFRAYADHMASPAWRDAFEEVVAVSDAETAAVMCSESLWWRCHRRFIADAGVLLRDLDVRHLRHDGRRELHRVTAGARPAGDRVIYDRDEHLRPAGEQPRLFGGDAAESG